MTAQIGRVAGLAAAAVVGVVVLAPAASAAAGAPAAPAACKATTSPLKTCGPQVKAPAGVITLGQPMTMGAADQATGTTTSFNVHHHAVGKKSVGKSGSVSYSYTPTTPGTYVTSISGTQLTGALGAHLAGAGSRLTKGYGKTYKTKVKPAAKKGHAVLPDLTAEAATSPNLALAAAAQTPVAVTKAAAVQPTTGVSFDAHDGVVTGLAGLVLVGGVAGSSYVGRRRRATV